MKKLLCPSMMCANYSELLNEIKNLDEAGIDIFHCDIMDGTFVPNLAMSIYEVKFIKENTNKKVDVHLMIENPERYVELFAKNGADIIYIHPEAERYSIRTLIKIKDLGKEAGIAINPDTSISEIKELLNFVNYVMIMTVNPGFAGQKYIESMNLKIEEILKYKENHDFKLMVDGAISPKKITLLSKIGVDGFILGTSALFNKEKSYKKIVEELQAI